MKLAYLCERCLELLNVAGGVRFAVGHAPICPPKRCDCGHAAVVIVDRDQYQVELSEPLARVLRIFLGSEGDATKALYANLEDLGPAGQIAVNLFRALKSSSRAKVYRGGRYRGMAYDRKQWAMDNLAELLARHAEACGIAWGWGLDPAQEHHCHVLYVDLPTGQVSFHTARRGKGPDYPAIWDGALHQSTGRVCRWVAQLLEAKVPA